MLILEAFILATVFCGFLGIVLKKNLMMKIISMDVMSTGIIGFYVFVAAQSGLFTPIANADGVVVVGVDAAAGAASGADAALTAAEAATGVVAYADPVPQAVILTAIVIGFSIQALMLVGVMKLARDNPTLECNEIERTYTP